MNPLSPTDWLARFIFNRNHYSPDKRVVKYGAFLPHRNAETSVLEVSVFRITGLPEVEIWSVGELEVAEKSGRTLRARADISVATVQAKELHADLDDIPPGHANIVGWPDEKSKQKLMAIELAASALLRVK